MVDLLEDLRILDPIFNNFNPRELANGLIDLIEGFLPDGIDMPDWLEDILALNRVRLHFHMKVKSKTEVCESVSKDRKEKLCTAFLLYAYGDTPIQREYANMVHMKTTLYVDGPPSFGKTDKIRSIV